LEAIAQATALEPAQLLPVLTCLEIKGLVRLSPGRGFSRAN
jgi:predicted Rossmann fold nucleotide-binding protein DprA/Smf involved in DNA uptake